MKSFELNSTSLEYVSGSGNGYIAKFDCSDYTKRYINDLGIKLYASPESHGKIDLRVYQNGGVWSRDCFLRFYRDDMTPGQGEWVTTWLSQQSTAPDATARANIQKALTDGFYIYKLMGSSVVPTRGATLYLNTYQGVVTPTVVSPTSGTLRRGMRYWLRWTTDAEDDLEQRNATVWVDIQYGDGSNGQSIQLSGTDTQYLLDTANWSAATSIRWRVRVAAYMSGTQTSSQWYTLSMADATASISDMRPSGQTYYGFNQLFAWDFSVDADSSAVDSTVRQNGAVVQYRTDAMAEPAQLATASGDTMHATVYCGNIPVGNYEWRVVITSNLGATYTSAWQSCTNVEVELALNDLSPADGSYAPRHISNRFSWTLAPKKDDAPGEINQRSAVFYWRNGTSGGWTAVQISGDAQYCDIPAGTFGSEHQIQWYVVSTASTGTVVTGDVCTAIADDALSAPSTISPSGIYADDSVDGITFAWQHSIETGTAQCGWELSYSTDSGASYAVLATADTDAQTYTSTPGTFSSGTIYWRVRTKNTDGVFGSYSGAAVFAIRRAPAAPTITYCSGKPLALVRWQSAEQVGYEVEIDGASEGLTYGPEKSWQSDAVLADGKHTIRVRIINTFGDRSAWSAVTFAVANQPWGALAATATATWAEVQISWTIAGACAAVYVLRDGELIAKAKDGKNSIVDRYTGREHNYIVRAFNADGYYVDSDAAPAAPSVPYGAIGEADGDAWQLMKYKPQRDIYSRSTTRAGKSQQYWGHELPVWQDAGYDTITHTIQYVYGDLPDVEALRSLRGKQVIYKDCDGHLAAGVFAEISDSATGSSTHCTLKIIETEREAVRYDPI